MAGSLQGVRALDPGRCLRAGARPTAPAVALAHGRSAGPIAAAVDASSARPSPQGRDSDFDASKKVKGRKRRMEVDTLDLLLTVTVTAANVQVRGDTNEVVKQACRKPPPWSGCSPMGLTVAGASKPSNTPTASASKSGAGLTIVRSARGMIHSSCTDGCRWSGSLCCPSTGELNAHTLNTSAAGAWSCTTTARRRSPPRGPDSPGLVSSPADSSTSIDFVYPFLVAQNLA